MCQIIIARKRKPSLEYLRKHERINRDGGGIAWVEHGKVNYIKNLTARQMYDIAIHKPLPIIFHFRLASAGGKRPGLCHPFPLDSKTEDTKGKSTAVLFHNGHVGNWKEILFAFCASRNIRIKNVEQFSDTKAMAFILSFVTRKSYNLLKLRTGNRWAILHADKSIEKYGDWDKEHGFELANLNHRWFHYTTPSSHRYTRYDSDREYYSMPFGSNGAARTAKQYDGDNNPFGCIDYKWDDELQEWIRADGQRG